MNFSFVFFNQVYSLLFDTSIRVERHCATLSFTAEERLCHVSVFLANTVVDFFFFFFFFKVYSATDGSLRWPESQLLRICKLNILWPCMLYKVYNIIYKNTIFINNDFIRFQYMCFYVLLSLSFFPTQRWDTLLRRINTKYRILRFVNANVISTINRVFFSYAKFYSHSFA